MVGQRGEPNNPTLAPLTPHITREKNIDAAIVKIEALPVVKKQVIRLRTEELG